LFYKNLKEGLDKTTSLKRAKIDFMKEYSPNPYFWAAFVLSGNTSKINFVDEFDFNYGTAILIIALIIIVIYFRRNYSNTRLREKV